ncbi:MAG: hypothetical protein WC249_00610 [Patescibacteria group bacterium]|jgi:hypothetical protein
MSPRDFRGREIKNRSASLEKNTEEKTLKEGEDLIISNNNF